MTAQDVANAVQEVLDTGNIILDAVEGIDPGAEVDVEAAQKIATLTGDLLTKALTAYGAAAGTPITVESVMALLPNATPLTPPQS